MIFAINQKVDPNVPYAGHVLPRDKAPLRQDVQDPDVPYNGSVLPRDKVTPEPFVDKTNTPGQITIGGIILPPDTTMNLNGKKIITDDRILDGVEVFERIGRRATIIEFQCILRMQQQGGQTFYNTNTAPPGLQGPVNNIFAQQYLHDVWFKVFMPDSVVKVQNSLLNNLGIFEMVIDDCDPVTVRGTTNIPVRIRGRENVPGESLLININA